MRTTLRKVHSCDNCGRPVEPPCNSVRSLIDDGTGAPPVRVGPYYYCLACWPGMVLAYDRDVARANRRAR